MKKQLENRLQELQKEFEAGQKMLADLEARQASVRETLLRLSGAIQVLQEELDKEDTPKEEAKNGQAKEPVNVSI